MKPGIRPMTRRDKAAVMRLLKGTPEFQPLEVTVAEELLDCYLQDPTGSGYDTFVAEMASAVVAYICYGPAPLTQGSWDIYWIAVAREHKGKGIGGVLLAFAEAKIKEAHGRLAFVETSGKPDYKKTVRFYHSQGYETVCRIADFYAPDDDKLILQKRL